MIRVDGIRIDHGPALHLVGDDLPLLDQLVGLGPAETAPLQRLLQRNQVPFLAGVIHLAMDPHPCSAIHPIRRKLVRVRVFETRFGNTHGNSN